MFGAQPGGGTMKNFLALFLLCASLLLAGPRVAAATGADPLTPAERAWLAAHPDIVLGVGEEWAPAVVRNANGQFSGFAFDHLELLNRKLETHCRLEAGPWNALVEQAEARRIAGLTLTVALESRKNHFLFTEPFHAVQYFIYLRTGQSAPNDGLDELRGRQVGYLKGILYLRNLLAAHPGVGATPFDNTQDMAYALLRGDINAVIDSYGLEYWRASNGILGFAPARLLTGSETPLVPEIERCGPYLAAQIRVIRPAVILALGGPATKWLLGTEDGITRRRGVWASWVDDSVAGGPPFEVPVLPTYHPAYLLRNYTRETREQMWHDLQAVMARLAEVGAP